MTTKFFGREPAAIVGTIQAVLALLISFNALSGIGINSDDDLAIVIGVVGALSALYLAYVTSETLLAPIIEVIKAGLALGAIYSLNISTEQTGLLIAAFTAIIAGYQRDRVAPLSDPSFTTIAPDDTDTPITGVSGNDAPLWEDHLQGSGRQRRPVD